jgi:hypothetical protein
MVERKQYCRQCEARVTLTEASRCASRFCKVKQDWPVTSARYTSPELLAVVANAELVICRLIFRAADGNSDKVAAIRGSSTARGLCDIRMAIIHEAKRLEYSYHKIARAMNRAHPTVMHGHRISRRLYVDDAEFRARCDALSVEAA